MRVRITCDADGKMFFAQHTDSPTESDMDSCSLCCTIVASGPSIIGHRGASTAAVS